MVPKTEPEMDPEPARTHRMELLRIPGWVMTAELLPAFSKHADQFSRITATA